MSESKKQLWMFMRTKNILATLKDRKLNFQSYLKVNQLEKSLEVVLKTAQEKIDSLKEEFDIMLNQNTTRASILEGKNIEDFTEEEHIIASNWNNFNFEYNKLLGEQIDFEVPFTLTHLMDNFTTNEEIFTKEDMDVLMNFLGL